MKIFHIETTQTRDARACLASLVLCLCLKNFGFKKNSLQVMLFLTMFCPTRCLYARFGFCYKIKLITSFYTKKVKFQIKTCGQPYPLTDDDDESLEDGPPRFTESIAGRQGGPNKHLPI